MIDILSRINLEFKKVNAESYLFKNTRSKPKFPYVTYDINNESLENGMGIYIDVDVFDNSNSYVELVNQELAIIKRFNNLDTYAKDMLLRFKYIRSADIDTKDDLIKRRNIQLYCRIYKEEY